MASEFFTETCEPSEYMQQNDDRRCTLHEVENAEELRRRLEMLKTEQPHNGDEFGEINISDKAAIAFYRTTQSEREGKNYAMGSGIIPRTEMKRHHIRDGLHPMISKGRSATQKRRHHNNRKLVSLCPLYASKDRVEEEKKKTSGADAGEEQESTITQQLTELGLSQNPDSEPAATQGVASATAQTTRKMAIVIPGNKTIEVTVNASVDVTDEELADTGKQFVKDMGYN